MQSCLVGGFGCFCFWAAISRGILVLQLHLEFHEDLSTHGSGLHSPRLHGWSNCFSAFRMWAQENLDCDFEELSRNAHGIALGLRGYGQYLYESGHPRYMLVYAITAVQDKFPHYRGFLSPAWQIDKKWQQAEPGECRPVISAPIMRSALVIGLLWGWHFWVAVSMLGFLGMLHPAEFLALKRQDLVLPRDALLDRPILYVHLRNPKTARFARRQHAKIEDELVIAFLDAVYGDYPLDAPLFNGSASVYRRQWDAIMDRLQIPHSRKTRGATPAVLRGSGATHLYLATEDISLIAWRGRWTKLKTVEFYLQEVAAQLMLHQLDPLAKHRIQFLSTFSAAVLRQSILQLKCLDSKNWEDGKGTPVVLLSIAAAVRPISSYCLDGFPLFSLHRHEPMLLGYLELASGKSDAYHHLSMGTAQWQKLFWFPTHLPKGTPVVLLSIAAAVRLISSYMNLCCWDILSLRVGKVIYIYIYIFTTKYKERIPRWCRTSVIHGHER